MPNLNSYLTNIASKLVIRDSEKEKIKASADSIKQKISWYFGNDVSKVIIFGSYSRNTILPRKVDEKSDIDIMIVFSDKSYKPQTYLNKLRNFVNYYYHNSDIKQSNPTIVLSLNHIRFELVPALKEYDFLDYHKIPSKASDYLDWIETKPNDFNNDLVKINNARYYLIKPLIRVMKYWNAKNGYIFESYLLEKEIVRIHQVSYYKNNLKDLLFYTFENLNTSGKLSLIKECRLLKSKNQILEIQIEEAKQYHHSAFGLLKEVIPEFD
ncbi:nucleotidyltransferase domain-containing protein [Francisella tularensis subsp. novicida FSC159]|uniref:SMODS domain-containing nucleotidyltransferase n=1 Tax=Francisella tularensis TaxID=263 RepID=UPI001C0E9623|nr:nucleotidyltransferase domain-containing protein [Francisella tularensis]MBK2112063.1 nucleotidyltransferase domain-containing protein [Francisella tularensis subsp. novicida FSC159]